MKDFNGGVPYQNGGNFGTGGRNGKSFYTATYFSNKWKCKFSNIQIFYVMQGFNGGGFDSNGGNFDSGNTSGKNFWI